MGRRIHGRFQATDDFILDGHHIIGFNYLEDLPGGGASTDDVLQWDGTKWGPATLTLGGGDGEDNLVFSVFGRLEDVVAVNDDYKGLGDVFLDSLHLESDTATGTSIGKLKFSAVADRTIDYHATEDAIAISPRALLLNSRDEDISTAIGFGPQDGDPEERPNMTYYRPEEQFRFNRQIRAYPKPRDPVFDPQDDPGIILYGKLALVNPDPGGGGDEDIAPDLYAEDVYVNYYNTSPATVPTIYFHDGLVDPQAGVLQFDSTESLHQFQFNTGISAPSGVTTDHYLATTGEFGGGGVIDPGVTFGAAGTERLTFSAGDSRFEFTDDLYVGGNLEFTGTLTGTIDHTDLTNIGTNTHAAIDSRLAEAVLLISGSTRTPYVAAADTDAARGTALDSAVAAASSGDYIVVYPGDYDTHDIMVDGVTMHFMPGAKINYTGSTSGAIFDDGGSAVSMVVDGHGEFFHDGTGAQDQVVNLTNGGSSLFVRCKSMESDNGPAVRAAGTGSGTITIYADEILSYDGTLDNVSTAMTIEVFARRLSSSNSLVVELDGGSTIVHGAELDGDGTSTAVVEFIDGNLIRLENCKLIADTGNECITSAASADELVCINCEFDTDANDAIASGHVSLSNCWLKDSESSVTSSGTIKHLTGGRTGFAALDCTQSVNSGSWTRLTFTTETEDTDAAWNNYRFTVPAGKGGIYLITGLCTFSSMADAKKVVVGVRKNGTLVVLLGRGTTGAADYAGFGGAARISLAAGDYIEMYVYHNHGSARGTTGSWGYCHFSAYLETD